LGAFWLKLPSPRPEPSAERLIPKMPFLIIHKNRYLKILGDLDSEAKFFLTLRKDLMMHCWFPCFCRFSLVCGVFLFSVFLVHPETERAKKIGGKDWLL
jgi:hypothetical protein